MKALCGLAFALIITIAVPSGVIEAEEIEKTNTIERFNHPETSLVYPMLLNSGKSPKQAKEEIRRGMIEYDVMKAEFEKREKYLEGMKVEMDLSSEEFEKELIEEEKYCKHLIDYYNKPEKSGGYDVNISLGKPKKQVIKETKLYYENLTKDHFEKGYTWKNCLDYAKSKEDGSIHKTTPEETIKLEQHKCLVDNLLN